MIESYELDCVDGGSSVYVLRTLKDFDEYEKLMKKEDPEFSKWNPNFYHLKQEFEEYIGKTWQDKEQLRYTYNGIPFYVEYTVIALEDSVHDWYWIVENVDDARDIRYVNAGCNDLKDGLKK